MYLDTLNVSRYIIKFMNLEVEFETEDVAEEFETEDVVENSDKVTN